MKSSKNRKKITRRRRVRGEAQRRAPAESESPRALKLTLENRKGTGERSQPFIPQLRRGGAEMPACGRQNPKDPDRVGTGGPPQRRFSELKARPPAALPIRFATFPSPCEVLARPVKPSGTHKPGLRRFNLDYFFHYRESGGYHGRVGESA